MHIGNVAAIVAALSALFLVSAAQAEEGVCRGFAGTSGTLKYDGLKCALKSSPGNYVIRKTVWESKEPDVYKAFLPIANHTFTCELTQAGGSGKDDLEITKYSLFEVPLSPA